MKLELCITLQAGNECMAENSHLPRDWGAEKKRQEGSGDTAQFVKHHKKTGCDGAVLQFRRLKQEDHKLKIILSYIVNSRSPCSM